MGKADATWAMHRATSSEKPTPTGQTTPAAAPPPSSDALAALAQSRELLATARRQRRWTDVDRDAFRALLSRLDAQSYKDVTAELLAAANNDELNVQTTGSLF